MTWLGASSQIMINIVHGITCWWVAFSPTNFFQMKYVRLVEKESTERETSLVVWTDRRLTKPEILNLARWLENEGFTSGERTRVKICQMEKQHSFNISVATASIVMFLWLMSLAVCYYFFSVS